ncbi:ABC transporter permease [Carboxydocella sp. JDF658]|uniref:ABC transporter permease n=1 Tax=Carboxydocella sp. JDF658 TaxID=1926600 RepID=UPI00117790A9|nr:ABC transporter permease [Carboxydocella sp. JDF658]
MVSGEQEMVGKNLIKEKRIRFGAHVSFISEIRELYEYRGLLLNLTKKELSLKYKGSVLGFLWSFMNPLLMMTIYSIVFTTIIRIGIEDFPIFFLGNFLPWTFFQMSVLSCVSSIVYNANLIKKVYFPREVIPLSITIANLINMLLSFIVFLLFLLFFGKSINYSVFFLPIVIIIQFFFTAGLGMLLAALNTFFRDIEHLANVIFFAWFYITPIFFPLSMVPKDYKFMFLINPMTLIITNYTDILYFGKWPSVSNLLISLFLAGFVFLAGYYVFNKLKWLFAEHV